MQTTRKEIRKAFKEIGYSVSFKRNPFNDAICNIAFKNSEMLKPIVVASANCYSSETFHKHNVAFALANSFKGYKMTDTEQQIV